MSDTVAAGVVMNFSDCALMISVVLDCVLRTSLRNLSAQGRGQRQEQQQQAQQAGQRAGDAHDWVRQTVLEEQPFHAASSPNFARARYIVWVVPQTHRSCSAIVLVR